MSNGQLIGNEQDKKPILLVEDNPDDVEPVHRRCTATWPLLVAVK